MKKKVSVIILVLVFLMVLCSCKDEPKIYTIRYDANGATSGSVPESQTKTHGADLHLAANTENLTRTGYSFGGWNTAANGSGTLYKPGATYTSNEDLTLYVRWIAPIEMTTVLAETTTIIGSDVNDPEDKIFQTGRNVTLSPYEMAKYEVTQELFEQVMGYNQSYFQGPERLPLAGETQKLRPEGNLTWYDAVYFCNELTKLNMTEADCVYTITEITRFNPANPNSYINSATVTQDLTKKGYRLPTEAEWECAARGGDPDATAWDLPYAGSNEENKEEVAWFNKNSKDPNDNTNQAKTHQVGLKTANALGLFDMSGNVWEWCWDKRGNDLSVATGNVTNPTGKTGNSLSMKRGGSFSNNSIKVCDRAESPDSPDYKTSSNGLRICRSL